MKKIFLLLFTATILFAGCDNTTDPDPKEYKISVTEATGGTVAITVAGKTATTAAAGTEVTLTATADSEYEFVKWLPTGIDLTTPTDNPLTFVMPGGDVSFTPEFKGKGVEPEYYDVIVTQSEGGTITATIADGEPATDIIAGTKVTLTAIADTGYKFTEWVLDGIEPTDPTVSSLTFDMPEGDVTVEAVFGEVERYDVVVTQVDGGTVTATIAGGAPATDIVAGTEVTLSVVADTNYDFTEWVLGGIEPTDPTVSSLTFDMPEGDVTVEAVFMYSPPIPEGGVMINGIIWADRNVGFPGSFTDTPEGFGLHYQWNGNVGWTSTTSLPPAPVAHDADGNALSTKWLFNGVAGEDMVWAEESNPCPEGWKVPDVSQFEALCDKSKVSAIWGTENNTSGMTFTDISTEESIFLPAAGWLTSSNALWQFSNQFGNYWSSERFANDYQPYAFDLYIYSSGTRTDDKISPAYGCSVRCVAVIE